MRRQRGVARRRREARGAPAAAVSAARTHLVRVQQRRLPQHALDVAHAACARCEEGRCRGRAGIGAQRADRRSARAADTELRSARARRRAPRGQRACARATRAPRHAPMAWPTVTEPSVFSPYLVLTCGAGRRRRRWRAGSRAPATLLGKRAPRPDAPPSAAPAWTGSTTRPCRAAKNSRAERWTACGQPHGTSWWLAW